MRRIKGWVLLKYFDYKLWRLRRLIVDACKRDNVRQLRDISSELRRLPQDRGWEAFHEIADAIDESAERIVLRRIGM